MTTRRLSLRELEDIIGYEADFTGSTYKPTTTFLMAREIVDLRTILDEALAYLDGFAGGLDDWDGDVEEHQAGWRARR